MTAHSSGSGSSWNETLDVDQPHGLDYQEWNDIRIGTRKRMGQEHSSFADSTAGGIHKPGGNAVLAMEEGTATIVADGTLRGRGLAWDLSSRLWCASANAGTSTTGDWTLITIHPDKQWAGQDITWTGEAQFDASVEFLDPVDFTGPVVVEGSCDFSDVFVEGDLTVAGKFVIDGSADFSDVYVEGDISVDGILKVDGTATEFGGTEGLGLFYDPTIYAGGESITLPNGLILKTGNVSKANGAYISFASAFPNNLISIQLSVNANTGAAVAHENQGVTGFEVHHGVGGSTQVHWLALGH